MKKLAQLLGIIGLLLLGGCGSFTLANGNIVQLHEKIGLTGTLQVVQTTTTDGDYVDHEIFVGPGFVPMATNVAAPIAAARARRPDRTTVSGVATATGLGGDGGDGGDGGNANNGPPGPPPWANNGGHE
jgi:hypothetical protein